MSEDVILQSSSRSRFMCGDVSLSGVRVRRGAVGMDFRHLGPIELLYFAKLHRQISEVQGASYAVSGRITISQW